MRQGRQAKAAGRAERELLRETAATAVNATSDALRRFSRLSRTQSGVASSRYATSDAEYLAGRDFRIAHAIRIGAEYQEEHATGCPCCTCWHCPDCMLA
jgi:hypothetical protein